MTRATGRLTEADKRQIVSDLTMINEQAAEVLERLKRERKDSLAAMYIEAITRRTRIINKLSNKST
jgi:single-stranded DNA-specific DHH superfamily exonuclease